MARSPIHSPAPSQLIAERARKHRFSLTPSEAALWAAIRGKRLGVAFRRQVPLGRFIADFVAPEARLVVEVDGGWHAGRTEADARRDRALRRLGFRVLRIPAEQVLLELPAVLDRISEELRPRGR